ncbi:DUF817 family protein [Ignatzschineria sp. LJL83]
MKTILLGMLDFSMKQINSCIFGISILLLIVLTSWIYPQNAVLSRYDFLTLSAVVIQLLFVLCKIETLRESGMIFIFHILGMSMEIFKVKMGSWSYEHEGFLYLYEVPLITGFMYASVGSYILRFQRNFQCQFTNFPHYYAILIIASLAYVNFVTHHYVSDLRWIIFVLSVLIFRKTMISFKLTVGTIKVPFLGILFSIGILLWIAENIGTYYAVWSYPHQANLWQIVSPQKIISWYLLILTALAIVYKLYPVTKSGKLSYT